MKKYIATSILIISLGLIACKKQQVFLNSKQLTVCSPQTDCSYRFTENADLKEEGGFKPGAYRLFWNENISALGGCEYRSAIYFKTPMKGDSFQLSSQDIKAGLAVYKQVCICCNSIDLKPIGGYVKGKNMQPESPADQTKWLIEAEVILGTSDTNLPVDTLKLRQYFHPNFVYN